MNDLKLSNMKCTVMIWKSWASGVELRVLVLVSTVVLEPKTSIASASVYLRSCVFEITLASKIMWKSFLLRNH